MTTSSMSLLSKPFSWITIPEGKVSIKSIESNEGRTHSYILGGTSEIFDVSSFLIAKYPITNAQLAEFVKADGYRQRLWWTDSGWEEKVKQNWTMPEFWGDSKWNKPDYPVVGISWYEAVAFTMWLSEITDKNIHLPSEQQWQRAAQGDTDWAFAWGADWDESRCNWNLNFLKPEDEGTTSVTQYEGIGDSPYGVTDMNGNVWEWCATRWHEGNNDSAGSEIRIARGGGWVLIYSHEINIGSLDRMCLHPKHRLNYLGFRIACSTKT